MSEYIKVIDKLTKEVATFEQRVLEKEYIF